MAETTALTGWGRTAPSPAELLTRSTVSGIAEAVHSAGPAGILARGGGRAYGDAAQNRGGQVLRVAPDRGGAVLSIGSDADPAPATVTAGAGDALGDLLARLVPAGWILPALPGTRHVTVGGAVAADVHGKDQFAHGSLGKHLRRVWLVDGRGWERELTPADGAAFWATVAGMGLTGVVTRAEIALHPVQTDRMAVRTGRYADLDGVLAAMSAPAPERYRVAWLDALGGDPWAGRGVVEWADHARADQLPGAPGHRAARRYRPGPALPVPRLPTAAATPGLVGAYNTARWSRSRPGSRLTGLAGFFHQLDALRDWSRLYGPGGLLQYHVGVPAAASGVLREVVTELRRAGCPPLLAVLKRHGPSDPAMLSFCDDGWGLALDMAAGNPALRPTLRRLDVRVAEVGGRVYLAKDSAVSAEVLAAMYPRLDEWRSARDELDPAGRFRSDLGRRTGLVA